MNVLISFEALFSRAEKVKNDVRTREIRLEGGLFWEGNSKLS
jgi:hypothetical protein